MGRTTRKKEMVQSGEPTEETSPSGTELLDTLGAELVPTRLDWLWKHRIPSHMVTLFQGSKGAGKSSWMRLIAAHVTGGPMLPGLRGKPKVLGSVLWYAGEEPLASWVRPACEACGVDMERIRFGDLSSLESSHRLALPSDCDRLIRRIKQTKAALVVLDPILSFSDGTLDIESGSIQPRQFMLQLQQICDATGCTMLASRNLTKDTSRGALAAGRGSGELANFARSILHCQQLPGEVGRYGLAVAAGNLGPPCPTVAYRIGMQAGCAVIEYEGLIDTSADDMAKGEDGEMERYAITRAKELIRAMLPEGQLDSGTIRARADAAMITPRTLQAAAKQLGIWYTRTGSRAATTVHWHPPKKGYPT